MKLVNHNMPKAKYVNSTHRAKVTDFREDSEEETKRESSDVVCNECKPTFDRFESDDDCSCCCKDAFKHHRHNICITCSETTVCDECFNHGPKFYMNGGEVECDLCSGIMCEGCWGTGVYGISCDSCDISICCFCALKHGLANQEDVDSDGITNKFYGSKVCPQCEGPIEIE